MNDSWLELKQFLVTYKNGHKEVIRAKSKADAAMKAGGPVESIREVK